MTKTYDADGYKNGSFMTAATVRSGHFDIFELDENGEVSRHFGSFTAGTPRNVNEGHRDAILIIDSLAANT